MAARKRSLSDMADAGRSIFIPVDEEAYRVKVLKLTGATTEDDLDRNLTDEALELGLLESSPSVQFSKSVDQLTASLSSATVASDSNNMSSTQSRFSQSTDPTSCSSSERPPITQSSVMSQKSPTPSVTSANDDAHSRRVSIKDSFRKSFGFRKRKTDSPSRSQALASLDRNIVPQSNGPQSNGAKSPTGSIGKRSSLRSGSIPRSSSSKTALQLVRDDRQVDGPDASWSGSADLETLRKHQAEERSLFTDFRRNAIASIRLQHQVAKEEMLENNIRMEHETREKVSISLALTRICVTELQRVQHIHAAEELESRQLQAEMDLIHDLETEKKACLIRLRHMEAYCHGPTPPSTPQKPNQSSSTSSTPTPDDQALHPSRKVTDRDFHNLAAQYRERDAMESLHGSKIEVLRGRQEKIHQNFILKKEREAAELEKQNGLKYAQFCRRCDRDEETMVKAFEDKNLRLQERWELQELIERRKFERMSPIEEITVPPAPEMNGASSPAVK